MHKEKFHFEKEVFSENYEFKFHIDSELIKSILFFKKKGKVLDIGVGDSGTSLRLAELGFEVTCIDISEKCINALKKESEKRGLKITLLCCDAESFDFKENYDIIIATGILHFLSRDKVLGFLEKLKNHTNKDGLNIIDAFLKGSKCERDSEGYYFKKGELLKIYSDWQVLKHEFYKDSEENLCEFLICQRN